MDKSSLFEIVKLFPISDEVVDILPIGNGFINDTFGVVVRTDDECKYVLQRINDSVFEDVETLQNNIFSVTNHIRAFLEKKGTNDVDRRVLTFIKTKEGKTFADKDGTKWRLAYFIEGSKSYESVTPQLAHAAGLAYGEFHAMLSDIPEGVLGETIPNFHNMSFRLMQLDEAVEVDPKGRVAEVGELLSEIDKRREEMTVQERLYAKGELPKRITHCDTKVNNILFDKESDEVLCVIDLDTVMPGFVLSDIGDFIRTAVNKGAEDDECLSNIQVDMDIFRSFITGYMESSSCFLTPVEVSMLPYGGRLLTYMQCVRFLTDYINGDTYYKTTKSKHNLIRAKAQFEFLTRLEEKQREMDDFMCPWL